MGKDRRNHHRRNTRGHRRTPAAIRLRLAPTVVEPLTPLSIPWTTAHEPHTLEMAEDGTACVPFAATSEQQSGFAVFNAEGLLRELVVLDGPVGGLSSRDAAFLTNFIMKRRELGDPALSVMTEEVVEPMRLARATCPGPGELHHWTYEPFEPALDGSRSVFVRDRDGIRVLMVIDRDLQVVDGLWIDPLFSGRCDRSWFEAFNEFRQRRHTVGDPRFGPRPAQPTTQDDQVA